MELMFYNSQVFPDVNLRMCNSQITDFTTQHQNFIENRLECEMTGMYVGE